jgi:TRAP-type C4-dicarboxylate transport system permease small subunit
MTKPSAPAATDEATDALFREWEAMEARTNLADLRPVDSIAFTFFWALFGVVFLQFFSRYVMQNSYGWTEEIARYLLIGVCFAGSVMAVRKGTHIAVEAMLNFLAAPQRRLAHIAIDGIMLGFCALMTWHAFVLSGRTNQYMVSIDIPKSVIYYGVTLAFAGMTIYAAIRLVKRIRGTLEESGGLILD